MLHSTPIEFIVVPEYRQRKDFNKEKLLELSASMDKPAGLLHPIVTRMVEGKPILVAGERRLRTLILRAESGKSVFCGGQTFPPGFAPTIDLGDLDPFSALEAELEENIRRVDLSWQERASAEANLHAIRAKQKADQGGKQTVLDTTVEARGYDNPSAVSGTIQQQVSHNLILAKHLDDPDVARAKTAKEAIKVVQRKAEAQKRVTLAAKFDQERAESPSSPHTFILGDALEELQKLPDGTFQILITDPPYGIDADSFGDQSFARHEYSDSEEYFRNLANALAEESFRVCAQSAHAYVFCDPRRFQELSTLFELAGWYVWATPLVWAKNTGMLPRPEHGPRRTYETILYAIKGDKKTNMVRGDVLIHPSVRRVIHGAQKPVALFKDLLERSASPGDSVLDPFAGTGTVFAACNALRLHATGIEKADEYAAICKLRLLRTDDSVGEEEEEEAQDSSGDDPGDDLSDLDLALEGEMGGMNSHSRQPVFGV